MNKPAPRLPRPTSIAIEVIDYLREQPEYRASWSELKSVYDSYSNGKPEYTGIALSRILKKYATRPSRGQYVLKPEFRQDAPDTCTDPVCTVNDWREVGREFKIGDVVRLLPPGHGPRTTLYGRSHPAGGYIKAGDVFRVTDAYANGNGDSKQFIMLEGIGEGGWFSNNFELVERPISEPQFVETGVDFEDLFGPEKPEPKPLAPEDEQQNPNDVTQKIRDLRDQTQDACERIERIRQDGRLQDVYHDLGIALDYLLDIRDGFDDLLRP